MFHKFRWVSLGLIGVAVAKIKVSTLMPLLALLTVFGAQSVNASRDLFSVEVPVKSQSAAERRRAASEGLRKVLLRISGSQEAVYSEQLFEKIEAAEKYVQQFQYLKLDDAEQLEDEYKVKIRLEFSQIFVERLIREGGFRYWPVDRPKTLVWLVEDNIDSGKQLLNIDNESTITQSLFNAARERGVPLAFPVLDLEDNIALSAQKVWNLDEQSILAASERYDVDVILVGRFIRTFDGRVKATWLFYHNDESQIYDVTRGTESPEQLRTLGREAVYPLANFLANKYAIAPSTSDSAGAHLVLRGIDNYSSYRSVLNYLEKLAVINDVKLVEVEKDSLHIVLEVDVDVNRLESTFQLEKKMRPTLNQNTQDIPAWQLGRKGSAENPLYYVWSQSAGL